MHIVTIDVRGLAYYIIMHLGFWSGKVEIQIEEKVICYQLELRKRNVPIDSYSFYMVYITGYLGMLLVLKMIHASSWGEPERAMHNLLMAHKQCTVRKRRICHCLLFHERGKQNFM